MKRIIEIDDDLQERIDGAKDDVKRLAIEYFEENPDIDAALEMEDLDYSGSVHEIIDGSVPIYTKEIDDLWYLYSDRFEEAYESAGIGDKTEDNWKGAAIYCHIDQEVRSWYEDEKDAIYDEWRAANPFTED